MPDIGEIYRKFGEASEAAQLLETELGTLVIEAQCRESENGPLALDCNPQAIDQVNRSTLGQLIRRAAHYSTSLEELEEILASALNERNRLAHHFYREHNIRRNSEEGRAKMLVDLELIHSTILVAYREVLLLSGVDILSEDDFDPPTGHFPT